MKDSSHSPCFQHGACFFQPSPYHTSQCTTNSTQTSVQMLVFSSAANYTPDNTPVCSYSSDEEEEEDFQMVPFDDEHWASEETPERTFCIHKHGLLHGLCQYPCPYENYNTLSYMDSLVLSDISDYANYMVTSSDEEILRMEEVPY